MPDIAHTAHDMISGMMPKRRPGDFVFATTTDRALAETLLKDAISVFHEDEGLSMILPMALAKAAGLNVDQPMCCITLNVYSSLDGVGLTAAVSKALGDTVIPCNMVAAFHHDHVFVPSDMGEQAMQVLMSLQQQAAIDG